MFRMKHLFPFALVLLGFCTPSFAIDEPAKLEEVVVTASRYETKQKDAPAKVTVIDRKSIEESGAQNVDDLLKDVAGVDVSRRSGFTSSSTIVTMRGFGANARGRTLVLVDGVPLNESYSGEVCWNSVPVKNVERIEIVHGAASGMYGPGAMGGVINIITKKPTKRANDVDVGYGNLNTQSLYAMHANRINDFGYLLSGTGFKTNGYVAAVAPKSYDVERYRQDYSGNAKLLFDIGDRYSLGLDYRHYWEYVNAGRQFNYGTKRLNDLNASAQRRLGSINFQAKVYSHWEDSNWTYDKSPSYTSIDYITTSPKGDWGGNLQSDFHLTGTQTAALGVDWRQGNIESRDDYQSTVKTVISKGKQDLIGFYLQYEIKPLDQLILNVGGRYDYWKSYDGFLYDTSLTPAQTDFSARDDHAISPKGSMVYHLTDETSFRLSAGKSFRTPTLYDLYRTWKSTTTTYRSNPNLDPEEAYSYELDVDQAIGRKLKARLALYYSEVKNLIYSIDAGAGIKEKRNVGRVEIYGYEAELRYEILSSWSLFGNYTYNSSRIKEFPNNTSLEGKYLTYTPKDKYTLGTSYRDPKLIHADISVRYFGSVYDDDLNTREVGNDFVWDLRLSRKLVKDLEASLTIENIMDRRYEEYRGTLAPPRTMMCNLKWSM